MILSPQKLLKSILNNRIIRNLSEREIFNPEGAGYDLRIESIHKITGSGELLIDTRKTSSVKKIASSTDKELNPIVDLEGNGLYLVKTIEIFNLPNNMAAIFHPRSTLFRSGVIFQSGVTSFGYEGQMTFLLHIANPLGFRIQIGARFGHVNIFSVGGKASRYRGQWQGGRITATENEKQK